MTAGNAPTRPTLRYHGGKWKLAPWIVAHMPEHTIYVEPFGGAASVLLRKPRSHGEVYNDLDGSVVNLFRVLRDPASAAELERRVRLTAYSREEFDWSYGVSADAIDDAHRIVVRSFMGYGSRSATSAHRTGFRSHPSQSGATPATDWMTWPTQVVAFTERLRGVVIENRSATAVLEQHDSPLTLHYVDPPYPHATRSSMGAGDGGGLNRGYRHEMSDDEHVALAATLHALEGMVLISGYPCALYDDELYPSWTRVHRSAFAYGQRARTECLWLNASAVARLRAKPLALSEEMAS